MLKIKYIIYNKEKIECNEKGLPILKRPRAAPRNFCTGEKATPINEKIVEKEHLDKVKDLMFDEDNCESNKWLKSIFPETNIKYEKIRAIVEVLALKLNKPLTREVYRRRLCCIYWLQQNLSEISSLLSKNTFFVCCGDKTYNITPPVLTAKSSSQLQIKDEKESQTLLLPTDADIDENDLFGLFNDINGNCLFGVFNETSFGNEFYYMD